MVTLKSTSDCIALESVHRCHRLARGCSHDLEGIGNTVSLKRELPGQDAVSCGRQVHSLKGCHPGLAMTSSNLLGIDSPRFKEQGPKTVEHAIQSKVLEVEHGRTMMKDAWQGAAPVW